MIPALKIVKIPVEAGKRKLKGKWSIVVDSHLDTDRFSFVKGRPLPKHPYTLEATDPHTHGPALISHRRMVTLMRWAHEQFGRDHVTMSNAGMIGFVKETDRVLFATFWNGTKVDPCPSGDALYRI